MPTLCEYEMESEEEAQEYVSALFTELTRQQLIRNGVDETEFTQDHALDFLTTQLNDLKFQQIGKDLRLLSEEFAKSAERTRVHQKAQEVHIDNLTYEEFKELLEELFENGVTREKIIVLFFFCSDIVVRAYSNPLANLKRLFTWSLSFLIDIVCNWVQNHGGWKVVLGHIPAVSQTVFYCIGTIALVMLMYKKIF